MLVIIVRTLRLHWKGAHILMVTSLMIPKIYGQLPLHPTNKQHSMLFPGLSQRAISQLDKHSEELALQRVNNPVISTLESIFCFIKRNIPELYKPWTSTSSNHSTLIGAPPFIVISRHGVVLY